MKLIHSVKHMNFWIKWKHDWIDADGHYWYQCIDVYRKYVQDVFDYKYIPVDYAKNISSKQLIPDKRKELKVGVDDFQRWDIITFDFWEMGHVGIVHRIVQDGFYYIDQNGLWWAWIKLSDWTYPKIKGNGVELRRHKYSQWKLLKAFRWHGL